MLPVDPIGVLLPASWRRGGDAFLQLLAGLLLGLWLASMLVLLLAVSAPAALAWLASRSARRVGRGRARQIRMKDVA